MLNSAYGVWLPRPVEPPITTISRRPPARSGWRSSAVATFVSGPIAMSVTGSPAAATTSAISSSAGRGSSGTSASGSAGPSSALSPWTWAAVSSARRSGRSAPAAIGTSWIPPSVQTRRAFSVTLSSVPLPATVVIARRSIASLAAASRSATASSWPGSQSTMQGAAMKARMLCERPRSGASCRLGRAPVVAEPGRAPHLVAVVLGELEDRAPARPVQTLLEDGGDRVAETLALLGRTAAADVAVDQDDRLERAVGPDPHDAVLAEVAKRDRHPLGLRLHHVRVD